MNMTTNAPGSQKNNATETGLKNLRYSDVELDEFRGIVLSKLNEARIDYDMLHSAISGSSNNGTDDTAPNFRLAEDVSGFFSKEEMAQLAFRRHKYMEQLQNALVRIQNKTYGICRVTGQLIPKERLRTVPHTTLSMDAKIQGKGLYDRQR